MKKNTASQTIGVQGVAAADGTAFTSTVTVYVTGDAGAQAIGSVGSGVCTHEGNGYHSYAPAQAETDYDHVAFTFIGTGMIPATVQVFTTFPQTGDAFARVGAPAGASVSADVAAVKVDTAAILADTGTDGVIVASLAAGSVTAAAIATGAIDADALAADAVAEIADGLLDRDMATGTDSGSTTVRTMRQALRFLRNKWSLSGTTLTVTKEDDSTASWTATVTTDAAADPITASDPAGP